MHEGGGRWQRLWSSARARHRLTRDLLIVLGLVLTVGIAQAIVVHNQARVRAQAAESATSTTSTPPTSARPAPAKKPATTTTAAPTTTVAPRPGASEKAFCAAARSASGGVGQELDVLFGGGPLAQPLGAQYGMHLVQASWPLGDANLTTQAQKVRSAIIATAHGLPGGGGDRYEPALLRAEDVVWAAAAIDNWTAAHCGPVSS